MKSVVILGAGISGLTLGWYLKKNYGSSIDLTILDTSSRVGGWIQTLHKEDFLFELGPRSCRASGTGLDTLQLIEELGIQDQVITANAAAKKRFLYLDRQLQELPSSLFQCFTSSLMKWLPQAIFNDLWSRKRAQKDSNQKKFIPDESIHDFFSRRFHPTLANIYIDSLVKGIYAGEARKLSLKACFPSLYQSEQDYGSVIKGLLFSARPKRVLTPFISNVSKSGLFSFKEGMETLPLALSEKLSSHLQLNCGKYTLDFQPSYVKIKWEDGRVLTADHLISTLPAHQLSLLTQQDFDAVEFTSVAVVSLGYRKKVWNKQGFGYLIPSQENESILRVVWDSCVFPDQNKQDDQTRFTVMIGASFLPEFIDCTSEDFLRIALQAIDKHLNIKDFPDVTEVTIAKKAIPQYIIGHSEMMTREENFHPHFTMLGNSFYGVSVNDCIHQAKISSTLIAKKILPI